MKNKPAKKELTQISKVKHMKEQRSAGNVWRGVMMKFKILRATMKSSNNRFVHFHWTDYYNIINSLLLW